jgi:hypothetical protein
MDNWKNIRLELGRSSEFPTGSVSRAYLIRLPLDDCDFVDQQAFAASPSRATVRRHWAAEADERGRMVQSGEDWVMRRDGRPDRIFQFNGTPVRLGQQISMTEPDGTVLLFKIAGVR